MTADGVTVGATSSLGLLIAEPFARPFGAVIGMLHGLMVMEEVTRRTTGSQSLLLRQCEHERPTAVVVHTLEYRNPMYFGARSRRREIALLKLGPISHLRDAGAFEINPIGQNSLNRDPYVRAI